MRRRLAATCSAIAAAAGGTTILLALAALPRPWLGGYVSEAGIATAPRAWLYRLGILAVAAAAALLGAALVQPARAAPQRARRRDVAQRLGVPGLLIGAGLGGLGSALVPCTAGCPLPPYQASTFADLVHAGSSVLATGAVILAMLVLAMSGPTSDAAAASPARLARLTRAALFPLVPLAAALGIGLLAVGHGALLSALERATLATVLGWVLISAVLIAYPERGHSTASGGRPGGRTEPVPTPRPDKVGRYARPDLRSPP